MHISFTTTTIPPPLPSILSLKHKAGWLPTSAHPTPHLPDNIGVLKGFKLPQHRHLADGGERHAFFLRLDTNSF